MMLPSSIAVINVLFTGERRAAAFGILFSLPLRIQSVQGEGDPAQPSTSSAAARS